MATETEKDPDIELCLKCGSAITHVPYRYNGQLFHARCLLCNHCGRRLVGKPFITDHRQIFCGDYCKDLFDKGHTHKSHKEVIPQPSAEKVREISLDAALEAMQNPSSQLVRMAQLAPGPPRHSPINRVTDYPVKYPESTSTLSESDSMSTFSESSFTSDSSYTHDANKKPKKKILKHSNTPKKRHKNRVRWNPDLVETTDTESLDSMSSMSSNSSWVYQQHSYTLPPKGHHPAPPANPPYPSDPRQFLGTGHSLGLHGRSLSHSQQALTTTLPPPNTITPPNSTSPNGLYNLYRTYSGNVYSPGNKMASYRQNVLRKLNSEPQTTQGNEYVDSGPLHSSTPNGSERTQVGGVVNVPVLKLDENSVPDLDTSSAGLREKRHIFEIPSQGKSDIAQHSAYVGINIASTGPSTSYTGPSTSYTGPSTSYTRPSTSYTGPSTSYTGPTTSYAGPSTSYTGPSTSYTGPSTSYTGPSTAQRAQMLKEDNENDYDHLVNKPSPVEKKKLGNRISNEDWYTNEDIDEALQLIENEGLSTGSSCETDSDSNKQKPPLVPPKTRRTASNDTPHVSSSEEEHPDGPHPQTHPPSPLLKSSKDASNVISTPPLEFSEALAPPILSLHSPSCETLTNLDTQSQNDEVLTPSDFAVHPETTPGPAFSWDSALQDRVVEGAEDSGRQSSPEQRDSEALMKTSLPTSKSPEKKSIIGKRIAALGFGMRSSSFRNSKTTTTAHDGLKRNNSFSSKTSHPDYYNHLEVKAEMSELNSKLSKEDQAVLEWYKKPSVMKPVVVDTDQEIENLLNELEIGTREEESPERRRRPSVSKERVSIENRGPASPVHKQYLGTCFVCHTAIESSASLISFAGRMYHSHCFSCAHCGCAMRGKQIYTLQGTLVCSDDYEKAMSLATPPGAQQPPTHHHIITHVRKNTLSASQSSAHSNNSISGPIWLKNNKPNSATMV